MASKEMIPNYAAIKAEISAYDDWIYDKVEGVVPPDIPIVEIANIPEPCSAELQEQLKMVQSRLTAAEKQISTVTNTMQKVTQATMTGMAAVTNGASGVALMMADPVTALLGVGGAFASGVLAAIQDIIPSNPLDRVTSISLALDSLTIPMPSVPGVPSELMSLLTSQDNLTKCISESIKNQI